MLAKKRQNPVQTDAAFNYLTEWCRYLVSTCYWNLSQCSFTAGRLTSGIFSITWIVSAGLFLQAVVFLWILLKYRYFDICFCSIAVLKVWGTWSSLIFNLKIIFPIYNSTLPYCSLTSGVLGIVYPLLMAAMLGIGDGAINTQLSALLGILFKHDTVSVNSIYLIDHLFLLLWVLLCKSHSLFLMSLD